MPGHYTAEQRTRTLGGAIIVFIVSAFGIAILIRIFVDDQGLGMPWDAICAASSIGVPLGFAVLYRRDALKRFRQENGDRAREQGLCAVCGYNLTGNVSGTCPECGNAVTPSHATTKT